MAAIETSRRQQIDDVASALFRERGYAGTSVRDIAQALNLQGGSLYAHVASKEDLLWSIVSRAAEQFHSTVGPIATSSMMSPAVRLRAMIAAHVAVVTSSQRDAVVFLQEWRLVSTERRLALASRRDGYQGLFQKVIAEGSAAKTFRDVDSKLTAMALLSALNGIATWYRPDGRLTADQIADYHADLFLHALEANHD
jgi:AcrR family transcriptional regulator